MSRVSASVTGWRYVVDDAGNFAGDDSRNFEVAALAGCMVVERSELSGSVRAHGLSGAQRRVETLFVRRRVGHEDSALQTFVACLKPVKPSIAA